MFPRARAPGQRVRSVVGPPGVFYCARFADGVGIVCSNVCTSVGFNEPGFDAACRAKARVRTMLIYYAWIPLTDPLSDLSENFEIIENIET